MAKELRFVGTMVGIGELAYTFGEKLSVGDNFNPGRIALITEEEWDSVGMTDAEVSHYFSPMFAGELPPQIAEKVEMARNIFRNNLYGGKH